MAMEFVMGTSLETLPKTIDFNFEELKAQLGEALETYKGLVVTEDGIKAAKEDRAKLNKLREALDNRRKEVKKECMAPYNDFEAKVKELTALIDAPIAAIDGQLKQYEEDRKARKREEIAAEYDAIIGGLRDVLPLERLWQDSWYNVSVTIKKVRGELEEAAARFNRDMEALATVESEFSEAVKIKYMDTLDLSAALAERQRLKEQAERIREMEAKKAAAIAGAQQAAPREQKIGGYVEVTEGMIEETVAQAEDILEKAVVPEEARRYVLRFECQLTKRQAADLAQYLKENNISYRRI